MLTVLIHFTNRNSKYASFKMIGIFQRHLNVLHSIDIFVDLKTILWFLTLSINVPSTLIRILSYWNFPLFIPYHFRWKLPSNAHYSVRFSVRFWRVTNKKLTLWDVKVTPSSQYLTLKTACSQNKKLMSYQVQCKSLTLFQKVDPFYDGQTILPVRIPWNTIFKKIENVPIC